MPLLKLRTWWRNLPTKTRVKWIATILLVFAGTEMLVLAPVIMELAVIIDAFGLLFVLAAIRASVGAFLMHLWTYRTKAVKPFLTGIHAANALADFGTRLPAAWHRRYLATEAFVARTALSGGIVATCVILVRLAVKTFN